MAESLKVLMTLRPEVAETLKRAAKTHKRSAYVSGVVMERDRQWRESMHFLQSHGWELGDLRTVAVVLARSVSSGRSQDLQARELEAADLHHFAECVRKSCDVTWALVTVADEWRLGNEELIRRLGGEAI